MNAAVNILMNISTAIRIIALPIAQGPSSFRKAVIGIMNNAKLTTVDNNSMMKLSVSNGFFITFIIFICYNIIEFLEKVWYRQ